MINININREEVREAFNFQYARDLDIAMKVIQECCKMRCKSCKYFKSNDSIYTSDYGKCEKGYGYLFQGMVEVSLDFGCVYYEKEMERV